MAPTERIRDLAEREYKYGFVTDIEAEASPPGLDEDIIRLISAKKNEPDFMLEWRLKAYRHWLTMKEPQWANVRRPPINYQDIVYYSAPKTQKQPKSLDEVDPLLLATYRKLGIPLVFPSSPLSSAIEKPLIRMSSCVHSAAPGGGFAMSGS